MPILHVSHIENETELLLKTEKKIVKCCLPSFGFLEAAL